VESNDQQKYGEMSNNCPVQSASSKPAPIHRGSCQIELHRLRLRHRRWQGTAHGEAAQQGTTPVLQRGGNTSGEQAYCRGPKEPFVPAGRPWNNGDATKGLNFCPGPLTSRDIRSAMWQMRGPHGSPLLSMIVTRAGIKDSLRGASRTLIL
jgi:hypothetical protein